MKTILSLILLGVVTAFGQPALRQNSDIYIQNNSGQVKFKVIDPNMASTSLPWIQFGTQTNTVFLLPANGIIPVAYGGTGTNVLTGIASSLGVLGLANGGTSGTNARTARVGIGVSEAATNTMAQLQAAFTNAPDTGIVLIANGGTSASTALGARTALGLNEIATNSAANMKIALGLNGGLTTNLLVVLTTGVTNQLAFTNGVLVGVAPQ
jgi:hypothetical protein